MNAAQRRLLLRRRMGVLPLYRQEFRPAEKKSAAILFWETLKRWWKIFLS